MAGGIVLGSVVVSTISTTILCYISVAINASFMTFDMCKIRKNNIDQMFLVFSKFKLY